MRLYKVFYTDEKRDIQWYIDAYRMNERISLGIDIELYEGNKCVNINLFIIRFSFGYFGVPF